MDHTSFRQFLKSFCCNSPWSYALFWKLQQFQDQMLLIYEDGYYDNNVLQLRSQSILSRFSGQEEVLNIGFDTTLTGEAVPDYDIALTNDVISCRQYFLGQGFIGKVALSEDNLWLYSDDAESTELLSCLEHHPDEWLLPDSAGIKTTLIVPILPYGVLQLGSFIMVAENFGNVTDIKETIVSVMSTTIYMQSNYGQPPLLWSSMMITEWENNDNSSIDLFQRSHFQISEELDNAGFADTEISTGYEFIDPLQLDDIITNSLLTTEMDISHVYMDLSAESDPLNDFAIPDILEALENMSTFSCLEEEYVDIGVSSESSSGVSSYVSPEQEEQSSATDLQEAIGKTNDEHSTYSFEANVDSSKNLFPSALRSCGWFDEEGAHDYLLEAAVSTIYKRSDDTLSLLYNNSCRSTETSLSELAPSFQVQPSYETNVALTEHHTTVSHGQCTSLSHHQSIAFNNTLKLNDTLESFGSAIFKDEKPITCKSGFSHKNEMLSKRNKGKDGSKNNLRPKPRDRQLIQDRLKQLRKLVPSATKTSIDGLLEQTTKHMLFLRSVSEQAKKIKRFTSQKLIADKTESHKRCPSRTSFAQLERKNTESCPIIVTDMEQQGQFLIQMLCNSDEVFFEMIEVMRKLNLSIMQGVMEGHRNNWACFIVEASEGFNKLDIFWPLMRILQRNGDWMTKMNQWCI